MEGYEGRYMVISGERQGDIACSVVVFTGSYRECRDFVRRTVAERGGRKNRDGSATVEQWGTDVKLSIVRNTFVDLI